jgi:prevent-host-death family protein
MPEGKKNSKVVDIETLFQKFEELVDQASEGKQIVITKNDEPIAKLVPV